MTKGESAYILVCMEDRKVVTTISVPAHVWRLLRELAQMRAEAKGGRPSASAVVADLVQRESRKRGKDA